MRPGLQRNLKVRSATAQAMRNFMLNEADFLEIETPTLFKSTPEGAKEFLVPTSIYDEAGGINTSEISSREPKFYALAQSPQQYKQMLMVGGMEKYFQFARCYRDEGGRADRQPEFTQVDMEMSFVNDPKHVRLVVQGMVKAGWTKAHEKFPDFVLPAARWDFPSMTYHTALDTYGSDKPNASFGMVIENGDTVVAPNLAQAMSKREQNDFRKALVHDNMVEEARIVGSDVVVKSPSKAKLGRARLLLAQRMKIKNVPLPEGLYLPRTPIWISDFDLFEASEDGAVSSSGVSSVHHPFTSPVAEDWPKMMEALDRIAKAFSNVEKSALRVELLCSLKAQSFDLVCDGVELGGGSIRIHRPELQKRIFVDALGLTSDDCEAKFGHLLQALALGAPPHGGFALGFDRFVATLCNASSISDVLAFPKASRGTDPLTGAPCTVDDETLKRFGLKRVVVAAAAAAVGVVV